ncbi:sensor histidine kinase [Micromonospora craterilacus]|uniref:sensor histidine kinase n=1 Tax=Micromonospora craterilacus TaxID=1655439 RepID=UPI001F3AB27A|nr:histidine kinase [Micromonospora craterilacus]
MSSVTWVNFRSRAAATAISVAAIGVLVGLTVWTTTRAESPALVRLDLLTAALSVGATAWIVRRPVTGGVLAGLLAAVSPAATPVASFAALHAARTRPFRRAVVVAATGAAGQAVQGLWRPAPGLSYGWWLLLMTAAYAALLGWGNWLQARRNLLAALRDRARRAEQEQQRRVAEARQAERTRIAREMHDVLAHRLSLLAAYAGAIEYRPDSTPQRLTAAAAVVRDSAHQALEELREVITLLRRDDDDDADGDAPPTRSLADVAQLVEEARAAGQPVRVDGDFPTTDPPPQLGGTAYRIVREALTNARKHAPGQAVDLTLAGAPGSRLTIVVRNQTVAAGPAAPGAGTGLIGLAERVAIAGGGLTHGTDAAGQFRLSAWLPWPA